MADSGRHYDVVVIGAGPAGIAAACAARECNRSVALLDNAPSAGGSIWPNTVAPDNRLRIARAAPASCRAP